MIDWRYPYRSMDESGEPDTAGAVGWQWLQDVADELRPSLSRRAPVGFHIEQHGEPGVKVTVLYAGTKPLAATTVYRDVMNFAVLLRWRAPE